jgi:hypothetical protein
MNIALWLDQRRRMRAEARDEAIYMLRDHGEAAESAIEHELSLVPGSCFRRTMLKRARSQLTSLRRRRRLKPS